MTRLARGLGSAARPNALERAGAPSPSGGAVAKGRHPQSGLLDWGSLGGELQEDAWRAYARFHPASNRHLLHRLFSVARRE